MGLAVLAVPGILLIRNQPHTHVEVVTVTAPHPATAKPPNTTNRVTTTLRAQHRSVASRHLQAAAAATNVRRRRSQDAFHSTPGELDRMLGQLIVARFTGRQPSSDFLQRIRLGQIGGVILFADNISPGQPTTVALTEELQAAARAGGNPPLLIMTDQEGGEVRRVPGPPDLNPSQMATTAIAFDEGRAAGVLLRSVGINMDLAPVADVEGPNGSFLGARSFGSSPSSVTARSCAFAQGLASQHIAYTLKHFPGLGLAQTSTDNEPVSIPASASVLRDDYMAYLQCGSSPLAAVMVSSAIYPALTGALPAVMSPLTYHRELRIAVPRADAPTISDDLQAPALADQPTPARAAINAGLDMAMYAQTETASADAYRGLQQDLAAGQISGQRVRAAARAVLRLKHAILGN